MERYFRRARRNLESKGVVFSKHVSGTLSGATFGTPNAEGVRKPVLQKGEIAVDKESGPDFFLFIKHPALFTALLSTRVRRLPCYALVRNPLSVLASRSAWAGTAARRHTSQGSADVRRGAQARNSLHDRGHNRGALAHIVVGL
jgi:hypothetical protein